MNAYETFINVYGTNPDAYGTNSVGSDPGTHEKRENPPDFRGI
jgi:hypothetical protein